MKADKIQKLPEFTSPQPISGDIPGINVPQLELGIEVAGEVSSTGLKTLVFNSPGSIGIQSFTGFGFTPTSYRISGYKKDTNEKATFCDIYTDSTSSKGFFVSTNASGDVLLSNTTYAIYTRDESSDRTRGTHSSFDADGISIDFDYTDYTSELIITAYK